MIEKTAPNPCAPHSLRRHPVSISLKCVKGSLNQLGGTVKGIQSLLSLVSFTVFIVGGAWLYFGRIPKVDISTPTVVVDKDSSPLAPLAEVAENISESDLQVRVDAELDSQKQTYEKALQTWNKVQQQKELATDRVRLLEKNLAGLPKPAAPIRSMRDWLSADGKHTTVAKLISTDNVIVVLEKSDGRRVNVPKKVLGADSQSFVRKAYEEFESYKQRRSEWEQQTAEIRSELEQQKAILDLANSDRPQPPSREDVEREVNAIYQEELRVQQKEAKIVQRSNQEKLIDYQDRLTLITEGKPYIDRCSIDDHLMTLTVNNIWHRVVKQIRFQKVQDFRKLWTEIDRARPADLSRIQIVDLNGNVVGGCDRWDASKVWVID